MLQKTTYSNMIKAEAIRLGFMSCGISKAEFLEAVGTDFFSFGLNKAKALQGNLHNEGP